MWFAISASKLHLKRMDQIIFKFWKTSTWKIFSLLTTDFWHSLLSEPEYNSDYFQDNQLYFLWYSAQSGSLFHASRALKEDWILPQNPFPSGLRVENGPNWNRWSCTRRSNRSWMIQTWNTFYKQSSFETLIKVYIF